MKTSNGPVSASSARIKPLTLLVLLLLPVLTVFLNGRIRDASGPIWLSTNLENNYAYLLNSLNVANLHRPYHTDHPGTPVQVLGGTIIRAMNPTADGATLARNVLSNPQRYIQTIDDLLVVLCALSVLFAGYAALTVFRSLLMAILVQTAPFVSSITVKYLIYVGPEALVTSLSVLLVAAVLLSFKTSARSSLYAAVFGVLVGVGVATKFTFVPVALVPLIILVSWRARIIFTGTAALALIVAMFPIMNPPLMHRTLGFVFNIMTHTGQYGSGSAGFIDPRLFFSAASGMIRHDPLFFLIVVAGAPLLVWKSRLPMLDNRRYKTLLAVTAAQLVQFVIVAKHPPSYNLIPSLPLIGLNLALVVETLGKKLKPSYNLAPVLVALVVIGLVQFWEIRNLSARFRSDASMQLTAYETVKANFASVPIVTYYTASSPYYALDLGTIYNGNLYGAVLQQLYPNQFFYNLWTGKFSNFAGPVEVDQAKGSSDWFILRGCSLTDPDFKIFLPPKPIPDRVVVELISDRPGVMCREALYKATIKSGP